MKKRKPATVNGVAELAGVSTATVSRSFTPGSPVAPETRKKVLEAAARLGYKNNALGRLLLEDTNKAVGIIMGDLTNPIRSTIIDELVDHLQKLGLLPLLFKGGSRNELQTLIPIVLGYKINVLVVTGFMPPPSSITWCHQAGVPLLILNRGQIPGTSASVVSCDHYQGGLKAAQALVETAGCRKVGMVCGTPETGANEARIEGFLRGLGEYGVQLWTAEEGEFSYSSGIRAARKILSSKEPPDGLFCLNDEIAQGVMDTARYEFGLAIPDELAIIGYDDIAAASWPPYELTTVKQPLDKLINESVKIIHELTLNPGNVFNEIIPVEIVYRQSLPALKT